MNWNEIIEIKKLGELNGIRYISPLIHREIKLIYIDDTFLKSMVLVLCFNM